MAGNRQLLPLVVDAGRQRKLAQALAALHPQGAVGALVVALAGVVEPVDDEPAVVEALDEVEDGDVLQKAEALALVAAASVAIVGGRGVARTQAARSVGTAFGIIQTLPFVLSVARLVADPVSCTGP